MTEDERYENVCKPWMVRMENELTTNLSEILRLLRGKNGDPGLIDDVRNIKEARAKWERLTWIVVTAVVIQVAVLVFGVVSTIFTK